MEKNSVFIDLLKEHTNIDEDFIDTFFKKFKIGGELDFNIKDNDVAKFLGIKIITLRKRLSNSYSKHEKYFINADYIKVKLEKTSAITYMVNYQCFEKLAMCSDSKESETIRLYFIKLREFITNNQHLIYQAIENKKKLHKYVGLSVIYFFAADNNKNNIFKIGITDDIIQRLSNYNVGRINEVDLKYMAIIKNSTLIEKCVKLKLKKNQVIPNREIYQIAPEAIKKTIVDCYCKYVNKDENAELYKEMSDLLGLYSYIKNKKNIKPYVIINDYK